MHAYMLCAGLVVAAGGPYEYSEHTYTHEVRVAPGTYAFHLNDAAGDGLCCGYGTGHYRVHSNGMLVGSGDEFETDVTFMFDIHESGRRPVPSPSPEPSPSPSPIFGNPCGCESMNGAFCNYDYGDSGFCEACSDVPHGTVDGCHRWGLPAAGAMSCVWWCFAQAQPSPWPSVSPAPMPLPEPTASPAPLPPGLVDAWVDGMPMWVTWWEGCESTGSSMSYMDARSILGDGDLKIFVNAHVAECSKLMATSCAKGRDQWSAPPLRPQTQLSPTPITDAQRARRAHSAC